MMPQNKIIPKARFFLLLPAGMLLFFLLGGWMLALAYALIWFDKIPLDIFYVITGISTVLSIEFVTISILIVGMNYTPTAAFLFAFFVPLILGSARQFFMPTDIGPPFAIPSLQNFVDGLIGIMAGIMKSHGLFTVMVIAMIIKHPINIWFERISNPEKPIEFSFISKIIFNLALASYLNGWSIFAI